MFNGDEIQSMFSPFFRGPAALVRVTTISVTLLTGYPGSVQSQPDWTPDSNETLRVAVQSEEMIARKDNSAGGAARCAAGFVPAVLEQTDSWERKIGVPLGFLFVPKNRVLIRRGTDETLSSDDGRSTTAIGQSQVHSSLFGYVLKRPPEEEAIYQTATIDLTLYGCFSPYSFLISDGTLRIDGRAEAYAVNMDHTLQDLGSAFGADMSVWYSSLVEVARFGQGVPGSTSHNPKWSDHGYAQLGSLRVDSLAFPWVFQPIEGDGDALKGGIDLQLGVTVFDGGLFTAAE